MAKITIMSKADTRAHWDAMIESRQMLRSYCRGARIMRSHLILSMLKYFPDEWAENEFRLGPIDKGNCKFCKREFYRNIGRQEYCDEVCTNNARIARDPEYHNKKNKEWRDRKQAKLESGDEETPKR